MEGDSDADGDALADGETDAEGLTLGDGEALGDADAEGDCEAEPASPLNAMAMAIELLLACCSMSQFQCSVSAGALYRCASRRAFVR